MTNLSPRAKLKNDHIDLIKILKCVQDLTIHTKVNIGIHLVLMSCISCNTFLSHTNASFKGRPWESFCKNCLMIILVVKFYNLKCIPCHFFIHHFIPGFVYLMKTPHHWKVHGQASDDMFNDKSIQERRE
jgi:hypothetical protein